MPDGISIKISGIREVNAALYKYSQQLGDKVVIDSLKNGARLVQKEAKRRAPKDTGRLRRGIVVRNSKIYKKGRHASKLGVYLTLRSGKGKKDPKDAFYGRFVEDGWKPRGDSRSVTGKKFIKGAWLSRRTAAVKLIVQSARRGAEIVKRKIRNIR